MHMLGDPRTMQANPTYGDVVHEVCEFLVTHADAAVAAGVEEVWIDPGIGFGKTTAHNLSLLKHLNVLVSTGYPVVIGTSRKRFLGALQAEADRPLRGDPAPVEDRLEGSVASAVWAMVQGVRMVRVHDVRATVHAAKVAAG
jgi:dihydropteroate synthase